MAEAIEAAGAKLRAELLKSARQEREVRAALNGREDLSCALVQLEVASP